MTSRGDGQNDWFPHMTNPNNPPGPDGSDETSQVRFERARALFARVEELSPAEQENALQAAANDDPETAAEVRQMLAASARNSAELREHEQLISQATLLSPGSDLPSLAEDPGLLAVPTIDGFKILDPYVAYMFVGKGGFGRVYRGAHLVLGTEVAIKCLTDRDQMPPDAYSRFEREARLGATQKSNHLVQVLDCNQRFGLLYLVMEWVDGEDLADRIARLGPRPWQETLTLLYGMAAGLAEIHDSSIVHRDIKPANVMLTRAGVVKVADLGLARHTLDSQMHMSQQGVGTPAYMAPEQWDSLHEAGTPADVFSLGASAWHLLVGTPPPRERGESLRLRFDEELGMSQAEPPQSLRELILHCLEERPANRPSNGRDLLVRLESLLDEHQLPRELPSDELLLTTDDGKPSLSQQQRTAIRKQWSTQVSTKDAEPTTAATRRSHEPSGGPTVPAAEDRSKAGIWIGVLAAASLAAWASSGFYTGPADPDRSRQAANDNGGRDATGSADGSTDGETSGAGSRLTPRRPSAKPLPALSPQSIQIGATTLQIGNQAARMLLPARRFDQLASDATTMAVAWNRTPQPTEAIHVYNPAGDRVLAQADDQYALSVPWGSSDWKIGGGSVQRVVTINQPCVPAFMLEHVRAVRHDDKRTSAFLPVQLPGTELALHFVWATDSLLVCATEVSNREWLAFLRSDGFVDELERDPFYRQWWTVAIEKRRQKLIGELTGRPGQHSDADLPANNMHVCEAAAFARWLSRQFGADANTEARLPTTAEWFAIANANAGRPLDASGAPFDGSPSNANYLPDESSKPSIDGKIREAAGLESVWRRRQGRLGLYHLGGNVAEMCIDGRNDEGIQGDTCGGSFGAPATAMNVPLDKNTKGWDPAKPTRGTRFGFRLILTASK